MKPTAIALHALNGMTKGVAKIKMSAHPGLALVRRDDSCFELTAALNRHSHCAHIALLEGVALVNQPAKKRAISDQAIFHDFGKTCGVFTLWQGQQRIQVNQYTRWLMESADEILAPGVVHTGFASDRRINLREQGRGHLQKIGATQKARGGKSSHVTYHTSA
jgi:hypothetical protein